MLDGTPGFRPVERFDVGGRRAKMAAAAHGSPDLARELTSAVDEVCGFDRSDTPLFLATHSASGIGSDFAGVRTYTSACVAASTAVADAAALIARGRASRVVVAAGYLVDADQYALFDAGRALAVDGRVRPFSAGRGGLLLGDAVGAIVLQAAGSAGRAEPLARLSGWGRSGDAYHVCKPRPDGLGLARAITDALHRAAAQPCDLGYINAHGSGTKQSDAAEAAALHAALGDTAAEIPVSSTKSTHGQCAAGGQAVGEALRLLRAGEADVVVAGCAEAPLFPTLADTFGNARALARGWADDPAGASRPFDRRRNGLVLGEGAGVFVVERKDFADARGAAAHADVLGWGATNDAHHPTTPRPDGAGARECMRRALADAGLEPRDIGYLNAHGTSTKLGDAAEALAIRTLFGAAAPPVSSTKAVTGHMLGASGVVESAVSIEALRTGLLPPTHNLEDPDPECDLDHVRKGPRAARVEHVMSNSFGFGGHNVSVVYGRPTTGRTRMTQTAEGENEWTSSASTMSSST